MLKYKNRYWIILHHFTKRVLSNHFSKIEVKEIFKNAKIEYKNILQKFPSLGKDNPMAHNAYLSMYFLSFFKGNKNLISKQLFKKLIEEFFNLKIIRKLISKIDFNSMTDIERTKKRYAKYINYARKHRREYPENWDMKEVKDLHRDGCYFEFTKCPIAFYMNSIGLSDLTKVFCNIDYVTINLNKGVLKRDKTIAKGDGICDFWIYGDKIKNPK